MTNTMDYTTVLTNRELRMAARKQLKGVWGKMMLAVFVCYLFYIPVSVAVVLFAGNIAVRHDAIILVLAALGIVGRLLSCVPGGPVAVGIAGLFLKRVRGGKISVGNILDGFKMRFWDNVLLYLLKAVFVILWSLLLIVPGIVKMYSYSMAYQIMHDNPGMRPLQVLAKSRIMMNGSKFRLFKLHLSFAGWLLLPVVITEAVIIGTGTSGMSFFVLLFAFSLTAWVCLFLLLPYISLAGTNFYENLKTWFEKQAVVSSMPVSVDENPETGNTGSKITEG